MKWLIGGAAAYVAFLIFIWSLCRAAKHGDEIMQARPHEGWGIDRG